MTDLTEFDFNTQQVRVVTIEGLPWFVANDVCVILGLENVSQALSLLDEGKKSIASVDTLEGNQDMSVISESGMLVLVSSNEKPEAKEFRKWAILVVFPVVFRTNSYSLEWLD